MSLVVPRVVIVGASLAGLQAAQTIQRSGFEGEIVLVGEEAHYPYDRPPLSKQFLAGDWDEEKLRLRGAKDPDEFGFVWRLGVRAVALDLDTRELLVTKAPGLSSALDVGTGHALGGRANGSVSEVGADSATNEDAERIAFSGLVIATGARARTLPGCELDGVHVLRTLDDARSLQIELAGNPKKVCVIGAGFIGAEVAATANQLGHNVTMIEAADAPLARVLDRSTGDAITALHRSHGVEVRLGVGVDKILSGASPQTERVSGIRLSDGEIVDADIVVVGIGVIPNTEWLEGSGVKLDNGVVADVWCGVGPGIVVAGDVARWPNPRYGEALGRVEQWDNAVDQGGYVGRVMSAWLQSDGNSQPAQEPYAPTPWFWSDQYDRKIQLAGIPSANAEVVHGSISEQRFVQVYTNDAGEFIGAMAWNRPRHAIKARQLLTKGGTIQEARELLA